VAVHKGCPLSGREGGLSSMDILQTLGEESSSGVDVCTFRCKKFSDFWNL